MAKTIEQIQEEVQQIKNETVAKQNTATRVGGALEDMVEKMEADSISVEGKLSNLGSKVGNLSRLITSEKDDLVKAINETYAHSGGGGGGEDPRVSQLIQDVEDIEERVGDRVATSSNMGYVVLDKNKTFAEQVTKTNTIYEIRYEFEVGGTEADPVVIPENCVLKFEGGRLGNGIVSSNKLRIEGATGCFDNVIFAVSTIFLSDIDLSWFVKNDGTQEVSVIANNIVKIASSSMVKINVKSGIYNIANPILLYHNTHIEGSVSSDKQGSKFVWVGEAYTPFTGKQTNQYDMFAYNDYGNSTRAEMVCVKNLFLEGNSKARVGINVSHIVYSSFESIFIRNTTMAYVYGHSSLNGSFTTPCVYNKFENIFGWSTKLTDATTQYVCRFGFRLQSQVNACTFISCRAGNCDTGFALEDNIDVDGETFNSTLNWHSNQNQFMSCASEGEVIGIYVNAEYNTFIGHRFEGVRDFNLYFPELEGTDNRQQRNIFICPTVYGGSSVPNNKPYNVLKTGNVYIACNWWNEDHTRFEMSKFRNVISDVLESNLIYGTNATITKAETDSFLSKYISATSFIQLRGLAKPLAKFACTWQTDGERFRITTVSPEGTTHVLVNSTTATDSVFDFAYPFKLVNYTEESAVPTTMNGGTNAQHTVFMYEGNISWRNNNVVYTPLYRPVGNKDFGTTEQRPTENIRRGFQYFDTTLNRPVWWDGTSWVDVKPTVTPTLTTGTEIADINGTKIYAPTSVGGTRPTLTTTNKGYQFFDTTLNKPIYWTGAKWVDATGADV